MEHKVEKAGIIRDEMAPAGGDRDNGAQADTKGVLWRPKSVDGHQLDLFRRRVNSSRGLDLKDYWDLHRWSVGQKTFADFWEEAWEYLDVVCSAEPDSPVVDASAAMDSIPRWFSGARLNYAENLLRHADDHKIAYYYTSERIETVGLRSKTFGQVRRRVAFVAKALRDAGVRKGDRVVGYLPNFPESVEIMAAVASLGAVWSSTSPDFGVSGVLDRFKQIRPKIIFSVEAVSYNLKTHDHLGKLKDVVAGLEDLEKVVVIPFCHQEKDVDLSVLNCGDRAVFFSQFVGSEEAEVAPELKFEQMAFHDPLFILYSSGTTGAPKCMVHSVGGTLMKHLVEHRIQGNRGEEDVLFQYTTVGWMMWNWLVSAMCVGTTVVLYDGSPLHPNNGAMWDLVDKCQITAFGTSAKWIAVQEERGVKPRETHRLTSLKAICSTGSPLMPHSYDYVYRDIKSDVLLASISGGSDIIACFMGEVSTLPVRRGEIQAPLLGCAVECWGDDGKPVAAKDESGELVITRPFVSMPVSFWNDADGSLYRAAYFDKFDGVWAHGDFIHVNAKTGGIVMLGRSDGTLNPNGVRFGSAEIYSIMETSFAAEVADSLCVGQRSMAHGERVVLFVKLANDGDLGEDLLKRIRAEIRKQLSARHVPEVILPVADIPYTVNGKKVEVAVKKVLAGQEVKNVSALANPESLDCYRNIPELQKWGKN